MQRRGHVEGRKVRHRSGDDRDFNCVCWCEREKEEVQRDDLRDRVRERVMIVTLCDTRPTCPRVLVRWGASFVYGPKFWSPPQHAMFDLRRLLCPDW